MRTTLILTTAAALSSSCLVHDPVVDPPPPVELASAYTRASSAPPPERWWVAFGDPQLTELVGRALADNLRLEASWARVRQARALARQAAGGQWPQLTASLGAQRAQNRFDFGDMVIRPKVTQLSASVAVSYEVDVWRKANSRAKAAVLDQQASRDEYEAMAMSVAAEVAEAWFDLIAQREQRTLLAAQLETAETFVELVTLRFREGLGSASEVYQQRQQVANLRARMALVDALERVALHRLAVLLAVSPGSLELAGAITLPLVPELPGTGVPGDLLLRRPDLRAYQRRVEAADWRVAAAVADRLPSLTLTGSTGVQSSTIGDLLQAPIWSVAANLLGVLFDGGRRKAEVERSRAVVDELLAGYGDAVLVAIAEVESALWQERQQLLSIEQLAESVELGRNALRDARARYREGLTDFLPVLTSLVAVHNAEQSLLDARRQALSYRLQLVRALGGTWTRELDAPGDSDDPA